MLITLNIFHSNIKFHIEIKNIQRFKFMDILVIEIPIRTHIQQYTIKNLIQTYTYIELFCFKLEWKQQKLLRIQILTFSQLINVCK